MRLFVGVPMPVAVADTLVAIQNELRAIAPELRFVPRENFHFTLKFLGDVPRDALDVATHAMEALAASHDAFEVTLHGIGSFPRTGAVSVIWAGVSEHRPEIKAMMREADKALAQLRTRDSHKAPHPHVTLARIGKAEEHDALRTFIADNEERSIGVVPIREIKIFDSMLSSEGPTYRELRSFSLLDAN